MRRGRERFERLRSLGDGVLYTSGFFADHLSTRGVELRYVRTLGARAYDGAATMLRQTSGEGTGAPDVFRELADNFAMFAEIVSRVADVLQANSAQNSNRQVVRLYERWVKTGSAPLAVALAGKGLTPQRGHGGDPLSTRRQRELRRIQSELERFYGLERAPNVTRFVRDGDQGSREVVLLRESADELEIALILPPESKQIPAGGALSDVWLQVAEGVSHFLYLVERARVSLPVTKLELELQAEVDKFVLSLGFTGFTGLPASPASAQTMPAAYSNG